MDEGLSVQSDYPFRGADHIVRMSVHGDLLEVEVEDKLTADQWRGEFDAALIEDLTHKTGNFKQFSIFCSMLESAIIKSSESVTLDLLTYTDLECLRSRKVGAGPRILSAAKSTALSNKRYLILIYSVEFDRIHYPMPLPYVGKPDPVMLQRVIRELKHELTALKSKGAKDYREAEIRRLRAELERAVDEKQEVESALLRLQEEAKPSNKGGVVKEVKILKKIVQNLEEELMKERTKHQRSASKRSQENRQLLEELEELKASERNLRVRVKSLTNELALYKKGRLTPAGPSSQARSASALSSGSRSQARCTSGLRTREERHSSSQDRSGQWAASRERSLSRERSSRRTGSRERSTSRESRTGSCSHFSRQFTSPTGTRLPRFDPTAYVKDKERKQREAEVKNMRKIRREIGTPNSAERGCPRSNGGSAGKTQLGARGKGRSSSVESLRSRRSYTSSTSEYEDASEPVLSSGRRRGRRAMRPLGPSSLNSPGAVRSSRAQAAARKRLASTPTRSQRTEKENLFDPSADLSEIDARLQALQDYMKNLDTRT
ncbi:centrosomal protein CCDC61 isoform X2 [Latimeria chalumnae]|nr:PREDICTED: coiled-coil domain-containing protein 61 [Latimeria chalumnae]|eukprot:XP_006000500.1 PREDICTED: coiled-coil domain-containing protein 61 [Latimeria chalumnae]